MKRARSGRQQRRQTGDGRRGRTLHLVDVDNLIGNIRYTDRAEVRAVLAGYALCADVAPNDHVVLATNHHIAMEVGLAWPAGRRLLPRHGKDGADLAILIELDGAIASHRYDRIVLGGGDHIYAPAIRRLVEHGYAPIIVSRLRTGEVAADMRRRDPPPRRVNGHPTSRA